MGLTYTKEYFKKVLTKYFEYKERLATANIESVAAYNVRCALSDMSNNQIRRATVSTSRKKSLVLALTKGSKLVVAVIPATILRTKEDAKRAIEDIMTKSWQ